MAFTYRSPRLLAKITTALLLLYGAGIIAMVAVLWDTAAVTRSVGGAASWQARIEEVTTRLAQAQLISWGLTAACAIAFCFWTHRVARNAHAFGDTEAASPGMAVGSHFIPIYNLWRPYTALTSIRGSTSGLMLGWWVTWIISRYAANVYLRFDSGGNIRAQVMMATVVAAMEAVALILAIAVVWSLTRLQEARADTLPPARVHG
jgi:uncharacterized membrane protein YjgN (DUF898 family)